MASVPVKSAQAQGASMILRLRDWLVRQRTQPVNAVRGHAAECGRITAQGTSHVAPLLAILAEDPDLPAPAKAMFALLGQQIEQLDAQAATLDRDLLAQHKANAQSRLPEGVPGIGPLTAISLALTTPSQFTSGRHFAAFLGLTPRQHSTGGKTRLGGITKAGNSRLRTLLVVGASAVIRRAKPGAKNPNPNPWLLRLLDRKPRKLAAVPLANKMARIVWAMLTRGQAYRPRPVAA